MSNSVIKSFCLNEGEPFKISGELKKIGIEEELPEEPEEQISYEEQGRLIIENSKAEAGALIAAANADADEIIRMARSEAENLKINIVEEARKSGYNEGYNKGAAKAQTIIDESLRNQKEAFNKYNALLDGAEADIVDIISYAVEKIIGDEVEARRDVIVDIASSMLSNIKKSTNIVIHVREKDYDILVEKQQEILKKSGFIGEIEIRKDITRSECLIETPTGNSELNINLEIEKLRKVLYETLRQVK